MNIFGASPKIVYAPEPNGGGTGGGGSGGDPNGGANNDDLSKTHVTLETHKELLDKFHNTNNQLKTLNGEVEKLRTDLKSASDKGKESGGDFKSLYESAKTEKDAATKQLNDFKASVFNNERIRALETELKKRGLKEGSESVMDFADLEKMPHEVTSRGRILVHGVGEIADDLQKKYSFAFATPKAPNVNAGGSGGGSGGGGQGEGEPGDDQLTPEFMVALEGKDKEMYRKVYPRFVKVYRERQKGG